MKAFINANIYDFENFSENQYVLFQEQIVEVGPMESFPGADEVIDVSGCIVMPGLLNGHIHIYSTFSRGMSVPFDPKSFQQILDQLWWKLDAKLDKSAVYQSGLVSAIECIQSGVTTIIDHHASGLCIKGSLNELKKAVCDEMGLRGIFCFETSDRFDVDECIEENIEFASSKSEKHAGLFGMHASLSLSDDTLDKISKRIGDIPVHVHAAESIEDEQDSVKKYNKRVIERFNEFGLVKGNSIFAHCVHINSDEARIIAQNGAYIAMNPTSNMNNAVGLADYSMFREQGIKCIIGNDGLGYNISRDYLNAAFGMKNRLNSPTAFGFTDLLSIIENGYEYASKILDIKLGKIRAGYKADMICVPYMPPTPLNRDNIFGHMFFGVFDNFHPKDVWCSGMPLMRNYRVLANADSIYENAALEAQKVWNRVNG